jgi:hypothetical protein
MQNMLLLQPLQPGTAWVASVASIHRDAVPEHAACCLQQQQQAECCMHKVTECCTAMFRNNKAACKEATMHLSRAKRVTFYHANNDELNKIHQIYDQSYQV